MAGLHDWKKSNGSGQEHVPRVVESGGRRLG
jgi:hypothetical protein